MSSRRPSTQLDERLATFREAGLLPALPTWWQIRQGELEMTPYVLSSDATTEGRYRGAPFGHAFVRQPFILSQVGFDHFRTGTALGSKLSSLITHLHFTFHQGMPVFDLQIIQTHPDGLQELRCATEVLMAGETARDRRRLRLLRLIIPNPEEYLVHFLGEDGWIARAEAFEYPTSESEGSAFPPEYYGLVDFLSYCARTFPAKREDTPLARLPAHLTRLATRRFRERGGMGWFSGRTPKVVL